MLKFGPLLSPLPRAERKELPLELLPPDVLRLRPEIGFLGASRIWGAARLLVGCEGSDRKVIRPMLEKVPRNPPVLLGFPSLVLIERLGQTFPAV